VTCFESVLFQKVLFETLEIFCLELDVLIMQLEIVIMAISVEKLMIVNYIKFVLTTNTIFSSDATSLVKL